MENPTKTPYIYYHRRVRNDYHCPICMMHFITLFHTNDEAYEFGCNKIRLEDNDKKLNAFKNNNPILLKIFLTKRTLCRGKPLELNEIRQSQMGHSDTGISSLSRISLPSTMTSNSPYARRRSRI